MILLVHENTSVPSDRPPADGGSCLGKQGGGPEGVAQVGVSGHGQHVAGPSRGWALLLLARFFRGEGGRLGVGGSRIGREERLARSDRPERPRRLHLGNLLKAFRRLVSPLGYCGNLSLRRKEARHLCSAGSRGVIDPLTLVLIGGLALGYVLGGWKPLAAFKKKPETAALTQLQADLAKVQAEAEKARLAAEAAKVAERQALEAQVRAAQQDNLGTVTALEKVPANHQTPEVKLAARMAQRVSLKLTAAIGRLPAEQQDAMIDLIQQALSDKQGEVDEANRKLAALDADFKAVTGEREQLKAEIPKLTQRAVKAEETAKEVQAKVTEKTEEVKTWANKTSEALRENGSLLSNLKKGALLLFLIWGGITFILPGIVKHLSTDNPFKGIIRDVAGFLSSPMLYWDAKKKINALNEEGKPPSP
jgi:hypothetical protein